MADDRPFGILPVVDVAPLRSTQAAGSAGVARQIEAACREHGFFYVTGHGVAPELLARLTQACAAYFALPQAAKMEIAMARGGRAWRGFFPVGAELTSGVPDRKEGLYFGTELHGGELTPGDGARIGKIDFDTWFATQRQESAR